MLQPLLPHLLQDVADSYFLTKRGVIKKLQKTKTANPSLLLVKKAPLRTGLFFCLFSLMACCCPPCHSHGMKKSLKGFVKTRHFKKRQAERRVTDRDIVLAMSKGELTISEEGMLYIFEDIRVMVDHNLKILITVLPKNENFRAKKLLSQTQARRIKEMLKEEGVEDEFEKFIREHKINKIE
jgi:hypothetical protein